MATGRLPDPNTAPVTAKGDLYTYSTVPAKLAVGNNGETLVADSSTATGLRYQAPVQQNPVLNAAMQVWQRGTSMTGSATAFAADRWQAYRATTGSTYSRQATNDTTNLPFIQYATRVQRDSGNTSTSGNYLLQNFESINSIPFVGKTVTLSFYARAGANYSAASGAMEYNLATGTGTDQNLLTGFTGRANPIVANATLTTTWQRFTATATLATTATQIAIAFAATWVGTAGANDYFEITGVQLEVGSVATPFKTYAATLAGELAACQRYYYDHSTGNNLTLGVGFYFSSSDVRLYVKFPVTMRTTPTVVATSGTNYYCVSSNGADDFINSLIIARGAASGCLVYNNSEAAGTSGYAGEFRNANASASLAFNAEL